MLVECRQHWECLRTARRMKINPAYRPHIDDGSDRCIAMKCDIKDTAVISDNDAHTRQVAQSPAWALGSHLSVREELLDGGPQRRWSCWTRFGP
eukprot:3532057-Pyramimonas_sp.AAC.1